MQMIARFQGRCRAANCPHANKISVGDTIQYLKPKGDKAKAYHQTCWEAINAHEALSPKPIAFDPDKGVDFFDTEVPDDLPTDAGQALAPIVDIDVPECTPAEEPSPKSDDSLAKAIAQAIGGHIKPSLDEPRVLALIKKHAPSIPVMRIEVTGPAITEPIDLGIQHAKFPTLLAVCNQRLNVWLPGPASSGKTTAARNIAKALSLPFSFNGALDSPYALLGYIDAKGEPVRTPFYTAYKTGGVHLLDEVDGYSPNASLALNAALANDICPFPDGVVDRHLDFVCIAAANTFGLGGTDDYVGRNRLDAAFLDRFVALDWPLDEKLELALTPNQEWAKYVQACRARAKVKGLRVVISIRASLYGSKLLAAGLARELVCELTIKKGMSADQWNAVKA